MTLTKPIKYNWFAVYSKTRCEKKVNALLTAKGIICYCPLTKIRKKYTDRYKVVEEPLFKSYVFVYIKEEEKTTIRMTEGVVNFVYWLGKPAIVAEEDINTIKKFLKEYTNVTVQGIVLQPKQEVKITAGVLMDHTATVKKVMKNKVTVELKTIGFQLIAEIDKKDLVVL